MTRRHGQVAQWARLYRLLGTRLEYTSADLEQRLIATTHAQKCGGLSVIDGGLIEGATEIDRMCGGAVGLLTRRYNAGVADVLGWLDPDRLAAVALALPEKRRRVVLSRDPVWGRAFRAIDLDVIEEVDELIAEFDAYSRKTDQVGREFGFDVERFTEEATRYQLGLPNDLTEDERQAIDDPAAYAEAHDLPHPHVAMAALASIE